MAAREHVLALDVEVDLGDAAAGFRIIVGPLERHPHRQSGHHLADELRAQLDAAVTRHLSKRDFHAHNPGERGRKL